MELIQFTVKRRKVLNKFPVSNRDERWGWSYLTEKFKQRSFDTFQMLVLTLLSVWFFGSFFRT